MSSAAQRIEKRLRALGIESLPRNAGVLHGTAVWSDGAGQFYALKIGKNTPRSPTDDFLLALNRTRADAIVTTGQILRDEPGLRFEVGGDLGRDLREWRQLVLGRSEAPRIVILTRGGNLPTGHPVLTSGRALIMTGLDASVPEGPQIVRRAAPGLLDTVSYLQKEEGRETVLIEAGPRTSAVLYQPGQHVDELMLSVYHEARLPAGVQGHAFLTASSPDSVGLLEISRQSVREGSGLWSFHRWARLPTGRVLGTP